MRSDAGGACLSADDILGLLGEPSNPDAPGLAHIEACVRCRILVAESLRSLGSEHSVRKNHDDLTPRQNTGLTTFRSGDLIADRFVTQRFVARGGMGEVYLVFDRLLEEKVALKTLPCAALDDSEAVRLVKAEVQMARRIADRHVCRILDFGVHRMPTNAGKPRQEEASVPFLTMAYLQGETLGRRIRGRGGLSLEEFTKYGREIALGLAAIHEAGVVHRDVKSDNVFLTRVHEGEPESAVVMDLGLAGLMSERLPTASVMGTQGYMSPQQRAGASDPDPRDDVFSMGKVLQEMALGHVQTLDASELIDAFGKRFTNNAATRLAANITAICQSQARENRYASARLVALQLQKLSGLLSADQTKRRSLRWQLVPLGFLAVSAILIWQLRVKVARRHPSATAGSSARDEGPRSMPPASSQRIEAFASASSSTPPSKGEGRQHALRAQRPKATLTRSPPPIPAPAIQALPRSKREGDLASPRPTTKADTERPHPNQLYDPHHSNRTP